MRRYAFFLDIDGTLCADGGIPEINRTAIRRVREAGHLVFINTARPYGTIPPVVTALSVDGFVCALGSCILVNGDCVFSRCVPIETAARVFDAMNDNGDSFVIEGENVLLCNPAFYERTHDDNPDILPDGTTLMERYPHARIAKAFLCGQMSEGAREVIGRLCPIFQHRTYAEFVLVGTTKASGIDVIAERFGIPISDCVAVGDSINDLDMLSHCGISVAMGNASAQVRAVCDIVTCDAADGGVGKALLSITELTANEKDGGNTI